MSTGSWRAPCRSGSRSWKAALALRPHLQHAADVRRPARAASRHAFVVTHRRRREVPAVASPIRPSDPDPVRPSVAGRAHRQCAGPAGGLAPARMPNCGRGRDLSLRVIAAIRRFSVLHQRKRRQYAATHHPRGSWRQHVTAQLAGARLGQTPRRSGWWCLYPAEAPPIRLARLVDNDAGAIMGTPIVIENKGGAGGMIAAERRAAPDGATFFVAPTHPSSSIRPSVKRCPVTPPRFRSRRRHGQGRSCW